MTNQWQQFKQNSQAQSEKLKEQIKKDWKEILEEKFKWIDVLFGVKIDKE